ncbi:MAG: YHYH protein [Pontiella sp.]
MAQNVLTADAGPDISGARPLGRYTEDYDYLGDLGYTQGVDFDLNEQNARWCITSEYPSGTWAYFICIDTNGNLIFPYSVNFFQGDPLGDDVSAAPTNNTIYFEGVPKTDEAYDSTVVDDGAGDITLLWSAAKEAIIWSNQELT